MLSWLGSTIFGTNLGFAGEGSELSRIEDFLFIDSDFFNILSVWTLLAIPLFDVSEVNLGSVLADTSLEF